jgi:hypothetical protein
MSSVRHILILLIAIALAISAIFAFFNVRTVTGLDAADPTDYAPDVFTTWESHQVDSTEVVVVFSGISENSEVITVKHSTTPEDSSIEWRGGYLVGDNNSLSFWKEQPGEMAQRWRVEDGVNSKLTFADSSWVLEKSNGEIVVWSDTDLQMIIPEAVRLRGGDEFQERDESVLGAIYDATVRVEGGVYLAKLLNDRTAWVFKATEFVVEVVLEETEVEVKVEGDNLLGVSRNHRTKRDMDILFDVERMVVEAVEAGGNVVWSIEVDATPLGESFEVDLYANRKYQTAFATSSALYVLDIKGNLVKGYPYSSRAAITGFSVMDYDHNRKFRFLVATSDGKVVNLKGEAKKTSGWSFTKLGDGKSVEHFAHLRVGSRDYVYAGCSDGSVLLLKRAGGVRTRTEVKVHSFSMPAFRLSSSIGKSTVLFVAEDGWLKELTFGDAVEVGMSGLTRADKVEVVDVDSDGKKEVVVHHKGKRTVWNSRNEQVQ